ncbi:MAG TPA: hypothetical protein VN643_07605 [Pyrinomonadaceae bacterium]|nr:hypothetical protein [Pyrinomonadaceae bacterium]
MEHKLTVTVPDEVYQPLAEEALRQGRTPEEEASLRLQRSVPRRNGERRPGGLEVLFGSVDLGYPVGIDNEEIDRDIARAIADTHEDER